LDLGISRPTEKLNLSYFRTDNSVESDHSMVLFDASLPKLPAPRKTISFRPWKKVDIAQFKEDIKSNLSIPPGATAAVVVQIFNSILQELADNHAPLQQKDIVVRPQTPWYTGKIKEGKILKRQYERQWKKSGLEVHKQMFASQRNRVTNLIKESKGKHFTQLITDAKDQGKLFDITNKLLHKSKCTKLPSSSSNCELAEKFSDFFHKKIAAIRLDIEQRQQSLDFQELLPKCSQHLSSFTPATEDDILQLIKNSPTKSCQLDPIPTWLLKDCVDMLVSAITTIVNLSISSGDVPDELKIAHVTPLLK
jgi:hypothetical protein